MRKIICLLVALIFVANMTLVTFADSTKNESADKIIININDVLKNLEKNNIEIKLLDKKIDLYTKQYKEASDRGEKAKSEYPYATTNRVSLKKDELLNWKIKLTDLNNLKIERQNTLKSLEISISKLYYECYLEQSELDIVKKEIDNFDRKIKEAELKVKIGQLKDTDLKSLQAQRLILQTQYNSQLSKSELSLLELKRSLGIEKGKQVILTPIELTYDIFNDNDIEQRINNAVINNFEISKLNQDLELTKLEYDIVCQFYLGPIKPAEAYALEESISDKEKGIEDEKASLEASLWTSYYNLKNMENNIAIEKINLELETFNLSSVEAKAKVNLASESDLSNARISYDKQKIAVNRAINEYIYALKTFKAQLME